MMTRYEETDSTNRSAAKEAGMKQGGHTESLLVAKLRAAAILALMVFVMLFAPLGQGGLSAGQGSALSENSGAAANALAAREVERLVALN